MLVSFLDIWSVFQLASKLEQETEDDDSLQLEQERDSGA